MQGYYSTRGDGWRLAGCLITLANELTVRYPTAFCLGTMGDTTHAGQGTSSDHNPFVLDPNGLGVVRAIDIGGPPAVQQAIFNHLVALYRARDPRVWPYGYVKKDGVITKWTDGQLGPNDGDQGHVHFSVTQTNGSNPSAGHSGYVRAIDTTGSWGFLPTPQSVKATALDWFDMATPAQLRLIVREEIHADNLRQAQVIVAGHKNTRYNQGEVNAVYDAHNQAAGTASHKLDALAKVLLYGDGADVPDEKNTHPFNLRAIWRKLTATTPPSTP